MSKNAAILMVLFVAWSLGSPDSTNATPLSKSDTEPRTAQGSVISDRNDPAALDVTPGPLHSIPEQANERTRAASSSGFDVGAIEFEPRVEGSLIGLSAGTSDHNDMLRDIYISSPNWRAIGESGRPSLSSVEADDRPAVVKWIYSILDAAGIIEQCEGAGCTDRVANR